MVGLLAGVSRAPRWSQDEIPSLAQLLRSREWTYRQSRPHGVQEKCQNITKVLANNLLKKDIAILEAGK
jgi:hypothetical protein